MAYWRPSALPFLMMVGRLPTKLGSTTIRHPELSLQHAAVDHAVQHGNSALAHSLDRPKYSAPCNL